MKKFFFFGLIALFSSEALATGLYSPRDGMDFSYRWLDAKYYETNSVSFQGTHTFTPHQFSYDFEHVFGSDSLTTIGAAYAYKARSHWFGLGISSASNAPFTRLNVIDFDIFYSFRVFQGVTEYGTNPNGSKKPYYTRLYIGVDYSTERILLDGYPLPVIRYEYNTPILNLIVGFPLTYIKVKTGKYQYFELKYVPVLNLLAAYRLGFTEHHALDFQFRMENKKYRLTSSAGDVYFSDQTKYYTDMMFARIGYSFTFAKVATLSPYAEMLVDGHTYYGKNITVNNKDKKYMGIGYAAGVNLNLTF